MTDHLGDDVQSWPEDPFEILGVTQPTTAMAVRQAYHRLIKRFRPDDHPEPFRRVREAYEFLQMIVGRHSPTSPADPATPSAAPDAHAPDFDAGQKPPPLPGAASTKDASTSDAPASLEPSPNASPTGAPSSGAPSHEAADGAGNGDHRWAAADPTGQRAAERAWRLACDDRPREAYQALVELAQREPGNSQYARRLYWLLAIDPTLDRGRSPCDWLARALAETLDQPLWELYRREVESDPEEAQSVRCRELVGRLRGSAGYALAVNRWRGIARVKFAEGEVRDDLRLLRPLRMADDDNGWARLLFAALDHLVWEHELNWRPVYAELEQMVHLHHALEENFSEFEYLMSLSEDYRAVRGALGTQAATSLCELLLALVRRSFAVPWESLRSEWQSFRGLVRQRPEMALSGLSFVSHRGAGLLNWLARVMAQMEPSDQSPEERSPQLLKLCVCRFLDGIHWRNYLPARTEILRFCLREAISPREMVDAIADDPSFFARIPNADHQDTSGGFLAQWIAEDLPLQCVYRCWQLGQE